MGPGRKGGVRVQPSWPVTEERKREPGKWWGFIVKGDGRRFASSQRLRRICSAFFFLFFLLRRSGEDQFFGIILIYFLGCPFSPRLGAKQHERRRCCWGRFAPWLTCLRLEICSRWCAGDGRWGVLCQARTCAARDLKRGGGSRQPRRGGEGGETREGPDARKPGKRKHTQKVHASPGRECRNAFLTPSAALQ